MRTQTQYRSYKKPTWAPPAWLFAPVWTVLYILIAISFGYVGYQFLVGTLPFMLVLPFALNLFFNALFTTLQFRLRNFFLASVDILLVLVTLAWALLAILPIAPWVAYINLPYLAWVCFATVLQITVTVLNKYEHK
ncbi:MAG: TspO/MBR family protein [Candidatus Adlerbacteria bacterium]